MDKKGFFVSPWKAGEKKSRFISPCL